MGPRPWPPHHACPRAPPAASSARLTRPRAPGSHTPSRTGAGAGGKPGRTHTRHLSQDASTAACLEETRSHARPRSLGRPGCQTTLPGEGAGVQPSNASRLTRPLKPHVGVRAAAPPPARLWKTPGSHYPLCGEQGGGSCDRGAREQTGRYLHIKEILTPTPPQGSLTNTDVSEPAGEGEPESEGRGPRAPELSTGSGDAPAPQTASRTPQACRKDSAWWAGALGLPCPPHRAGGGPQGLRFQPGQVHPAWNSPRPRRLRPSV